MSKPEVNIEDWYILGKILYGKAQNHPRFARGTEVRTSTIVDMPRSPKQGDKVETMNTVYILGKSMTADLPATPPHLNPDWDKPQIINQSSQEFDKMAKLPASSSTLLADKTLRQELISQVMRYKNTDADIIADDILHFIKSHAEQEKAAAVLEARIDEVERFNTNRQHSMDDLAEYKEDRLYTLKSRLAELRDGGGK